MKHWIVAALALLSACGSPSTAASADLSGTNSLVRVGDFLFVTSSDRNELRAFNLGASPRDFVRAPNPIEPLSIPVLDRPHQLSRDVRYDTDGAEITGPYLYARSNGSANISIVGADPSLLIELHRLTAPGPVTAVAAHGPTPTRPTSILYTATAENGQATLWRSELPAGITASSPDPTFDVLYTPPAGEAIVAIVALPDESRIAVATRSQAGITGDAVVLDSTAVTPPLATLDFGGPVRSLSTHPAYKVGDTTIPAGSRIFGVLNEEACAFRPQCVGIVAVDTGTNLLAVDATGNTMVPLAVGGGLPVGFTLSPDVPVHIPGATTETRISLLGIVTSSSGQIFFFDAAQLRHIDYNTATPVADAPTYVTPDNRAFSFGPKDIALADGAAVDEVVKITYEGVLPPFNNLRSQAIDGQSFPTPIDPAGIVQVGDAIVISDDGGDCQGVELTVSALGATAVTTADVIPPQCGDRSRFTLRAKGTQADVVVGTVTGYIGRVQRGTDLAYTPFAFAGRYYHHPDGFNPSVPELSFSFGPGDPSVARDYAYQFATHSNFSPVQISIDLTQFGTPFRFPGAVVHVASVGGQALDRTYVAFPAANALVEIPTATMATGQPNGSGNIQAYR